MLKLLSHVPDWAAFLVGCAAICGVLYGIYKVAKKIDGAVGPDEEGHTLSYRVGNVEKAIGVDKDGKTITERMTRVEYQLWPNGGKSLADRISQAHDKIDEVGKQGKETQAEVRIIKELLTVLIAKNDK